HLIEAPDVGFVQWGVDLVEQAERRWADEKEREHQRGCGERLLPARQEAEVLQLLSRRLHDDLHAGILALLGDAQLQTGGPTREQLGKDRRELLVGRGERLLEALLRGPHELGDRPPQILE